MNTFALEDFLARSTEKPFSETELSGVLSGLPALSASGPWMAGGALRRTLLGEMPDSDFDFFFRDEAQLTAFAADLEGRGFTKVKETPHHLQYRGAAGPSSLPRDIQLIRFKFYRAASEVIDSFDYTICQFAFDGTTLTVGDYSLWDLGRKRLAVHKITYPVASMRRLIKYQKQGFWACGGCLATILRETATKPELQTQLDIQYVD